MQQILSPQVSESQKMLLQTTMMALAATAPKPPKIEAAPQSAETQSKGTGCAEVEVKPKPKSKTKVRSPLEKKYSITKATAKKFQGMVVNAKSIIENVGAKEKPISTTWCE